MLKTKKKKSLCGVVRGTFLSNFIKLDAKAKKSNTQHLSSEGGKGLVMFSFRQII